MRKTLFPDQELRPSDLVLKTYTNERLKVVGTLNVRVQYEDQFKKLVLVVTAGKGPSLFGRNWLNHINLNWKHIKSLDRFCRTCQSVKPDAPWSRIHVDYAGPFLGKMFLVVVDAHSKWPEVLIAKSTTTDSTMEALRTLFGRYGLPKQLVSDNGPQFTSNEFAHFLRTNGIKHIRNAPYHPSSNGQAERFVQTLKRSLKASEKDGRALSHRLAEFLLSYRTTPHATTNRSPGSSF